MMQPQIVADLVEIRQDQVRRLVAGSRKGSAGRQGGPGLRERLLVHTGAALIAAGRRLQAPYDPALASHTEAYRTG